MLKTDYSTDGVYYRRSLTIRRTAEQLINDCLDVYLNVHPDDSPEDFQRLILDTVNKFTVTADELSYQIDRAHETKAVNDKNTSGVVPIVLACAYAIEAMNTSDTESVVAWSLIAEASYWTGVSKALIGVHSARLETMAATRKSTASKAASARHALTDAAKAYGLRLVIEHCKDGAIWRDLSHAARSIEPKIQSYMAENGKPPVPTIASRTVYEWVRAMPKTPGMFANE